jgi:putative addiction module killer protein
MGYNSFAPKKLVYYKTLSGHIPFQEWIYSLKDSQVRYRIRSRLLRVTAGQLGDYKPVGPAIYELRFHFGPGYRVYFSIDGSTIVVLLKGGDKSSQSKDILKALEYWSDYLRRKA